MYYEESLQVEVIYSNHEVHDIISILCKIDNRRINVILLYNPNLSNFDKFLITLEECLSINSFD